MRIYTVRVSSIPKGQKARNKNTTNLGITGSEGGQSWALGIQSNKGPDLQNTSGGDADS